jgi:FlaA1/EpsC-like NDP-sugar epimerase
MRVRGVVSVRFVVLGAGAGLDRAVVVAGFRAGVALSRFPANAVLRPELAPVGDFFAALFFTALGGLVRVPSATEIWQAAALAALVVVVTPPLVAAVAERSGLSSRSALDAGLLLAQASELSLVIGLVGMIQGHLDLGPFTVIVLATTGTMLLTPFLTTGTVTAWLLRLHPSRRAPGPRAVPPSGHLLVVGAGSTGREVLAAGYLDGIPLAVLDQDPTVVHELQAAGIRAVRGEVDDPRALEAAGVAGARAVVVAVGRPETCELLLASAREGTDVIVRVFDDEEARWVRERRGVPVVAARETAADFLEWFDREGPDLRSARRGR